MSAAGCDVPESGYTRLSLSSHHSTGSIALRLSSLYSGMTAPRFCQISSERCFGPSLKVAKTLLRLMA